MPAAEQTFTIAAVSKDSPKPQTLTIEGEEREFRIYLVKFEGSDEVIAIRRNPKTNPPKQGDILIGELTNKKFEQFRLFKLRYESNGNTGIGRTGQQRREDPAEITWRIAVSIAFEHAYRNVEMHGDRADALDHIKELTERDAGWLYAMMRKVPDSES